MIFTSDYKKLKRLLKEFNIKYTYESPWPNQKHKHDKVVKIENAGNLRDGLANCSFFFYKGKFVYYHVHDHS